MTKRDISGILKVKVLGDLTNPIIEFANDVELAENDMDKFDTPFHRRAYVRALFAMVEGSVYLLKQTVLSAGVRSRSGLLSVGEYALLIEQSYDLNKKGEINEQVKFLRLPDNLRFTTNCLAKTFDCKLDLGVGGLNWDNFLTAIEIRNRITHPKSIGEFDISKQEVELVRSVSYWFNDIIAKATQSITEKIAKGSKAKDS